MEAAVFGISAAVLLVTAVSGKFERTLITIPMLIVALGIAGGAVFDVSFDPDNGSIVFLELTLALVLFSDASRIDLKTLRSQEAWPRRMLLIGLPVAIVLGAVLGALGLHLELGWALLLGVILAPTDAALAEPVLVTEELPARIRQTVNVESGLNDGLALPALFVAIALIEAEDGISGAEIVRLFSVQLGLGMAFGVAFGVLGGWLVGRGISSGWMSEGYQKTATVALALATFGASQWVGASGFVAAFVAGMVFAWLCRGTTQGLFEFAENEAGALVLIAFLLLGAGPLRSIIVEPPKWEVWVVALLSIALVRPIAILLSMVGTKAMVPTRLFLGWFGPRGLATVVFLLTAIEEVGQVPEVVDHTVALTILLSVVAHGLTAYPASSRLVRAIAEMPEEETAAMAEMEPVDELPARVMAARR